MKLPTKPNYNIGLTSQQKLDDRESWYKLVVKIILWEENPPSRNLTATADKITNAEWNKYRQRTIKTNVTHTKEKVLSDLKITSQKIKLHGGFEE